MAIRQYIGARYVPRFRGTYDASQIYEALDVVDNGLGTSYIAKVPTPAGTPLTNTTYWAIYGATSGAIINLQNQINGLNGRVSLIDNKKVIFIGDSYCDGGRGGYTNGVYTTFCEAAGLTDGTNAKIYQKGGAGFISATQGKNFGDLLNDAISEAFFNPDEVSDIIIAGGGNDASYNAPDINSAKNSFLTTAKTAFPNAKIWLAVVNGQVDATNRWSIISRARYTYYYKPRPYVKTINNAMMPMMFMDSFDVDGIHPNQAGVERMGFLIGTAFINDSNYGLPYNTLPQGVQLKTNADVTVAPQFTLEESAEYMSFIMNNESTFTPASAVSMAYNTGITVKIGSIDNTVHMLCPNATGLSTTPFTRFPAILCALRTSTGSDWMPITGQLYIIKTSGTNADVYFKSNCVPVQSNSTTNFRIGFIQAIIKG